MLHGHGTSPSSEYLGVLVRKSVFFALAAFTLMAQSANAGVVQTLTGTVNDRTTVFKYDLSTIGLDSLGSITINSSSGGAGSNAFFAGLDLDGVFISSVDCADVACLANATPLIALDYLSSEFTLGASAPLAGVVNGGIDFSFASLNAFDTVYDLTSGFVSMGVGSSLTISLVNSLALLPGGSYFLYFGEVGAHDGEFTADGISFAAAQALAQLDEEKTLVNPVPGALPLMFTALGFLSVLRRRRRTALPIAV